MPLKFDKVKRKTIETGTPESRNHVDFHIMRGGTIVIQTIITTPHYGDNWSDDKHDGEGKFVATFGKFRYQDPELRLGIVRIVGLCEVPLVAFPH